jgi:hypothetical protein
MAKGQDEGTALERIVATDEATGFETPEQELRTRR